MLKDIREARQSKIREGLGGLGTAMLDVRTRAWYRNLASLLASHIQMPNVGAMEINEVRPFFIRAMGVIGILSAPPRVPVVDDDPESTYT